jgi:hypothetical protein
MFGWCIHSWFSKNDILRATMRWMVAYNAERRGINEKKQEAVSVKKWYMFRLLKGKRI